MPLIEPLPENPPDERVAQLYAADVERFGYLPNFTRLVARRAGVYEAWKQLNGAIKANMDERRYELATIAAARRLRSSYCMLAHGTVLAEKFMGDDAVAAAATDHSHAGLEDVDVAVMDLADKVAGEASAIGEADIAPLRELGLSDDEILDVVLAATARCFFSKTLDAIGAEPDAELGELGPALREALTVGRPIGS